MKTKAIVPMLVGVGIGLLALKLGWNYMDRHRATAAASQGDCPVVIAKIRIPPGKPLQSADLEVVKWPRSSVPPKAFSETEKLIGRVGVTSLAAKLPILDTMLAPPGAAPGLPALIPPGYQAMTVKVDEFAGVGGFLKPDDKVDVVATFSVKRGQNDRTETVTRTILRDITVVAVGQEIQANENNEPMVVRSVTLQVKPEQAQRLSLASTRGTIRLSLRSGQGPSGISALPAITFGELLNSESEQADNPSPSSSKGWLSGLFGSTKETAPQSRQVAAEVVKVDPPWQMNLLRGCQSQDVIFENSHSSRRVTPDWLNQNKLNPIGVRNDQGQSPDAKVTVGQNTADQLMDIQEVPSE